MSTYAFFREPSGTVLAILPGQRWTQRDGATMYSAIGSLFDRRNSPVASTSASLQYVQTCMPITEPEARKLHPALFTYLSA